MLGAGRRAIARNQPGGIPLWFRLWSEIIRQVRPCYWHVAETKILHVDAIAIALKTPKSTVARALKVALHQAAA